MRTKKHSSKAPITMLFLSLIILITIFIFYYRNKHDSTAADDSLSMSVDNTVIFLNHFYWIFVIFASFQLKILMITVILTAMN